MSKGTEMIVILMLGLILGLSLGTQLTVIEIKHAIKDQCSGMQRDSKQ